MKRTPLPRQRSLRTPLLAVLLVLLALPGFLPAQITEGNPELILDGVDAFFQNDDPIRILTHEYDYSPTDGVVDTILGDPFDVEVDIRNTYYSIVGDPSSIVGGDADEFHNRLYFIPTQYINPENFEVTFYFPGSDEYNGLIRQVDAIKEFNWFPTYSPWYVPDPDPYKDPYIVWDHDWSEVAKDPLQYQYRPNKVNPPMISGQKFTATWDITYPFLDIDVSGFTGQEPGNNEIIGYHSWAPDQFFGGSATSYSEWWVNVFIDNRNEVAEFDDAESNDWVSGQLIRLWWDFEPTIEGQDEAGNSTDDMTDIVLIYDELTTAPDLVTTPSLFAADQYGKDLSLQVLADIEAHNETLEQNARLMRNAIDRPKYAEGYLMLRLEPQAAAAIHTRRLAVENLPDYRRGSAQDAWGLDSLPAEILGLRPFLSGADKARRTLAAEPVLRSTIEQGLALASNQLALAEKTLLDKAHPHGPIGMFYADLAEGVDPLAAAKQLMRLPEVRYAEPYEIVYLHENVMPRSVPDDPNFPSQTALERLRTPEAWTVTGNAFDWAGLKVCVIDSGVRTDHVDLTGRIFYPKDVVVTPDIPGEPTFQDAFDGYSDPLRAGQYSGDSNPADDDFNGHGTACAGIIAAIRDNGQGVAGLAPVGIIPINTEGPVDGAVYNWQEGIFWGIDHGAQLFNMSFGGGSGGGIATADAYAYADDADVILFVSAGNDSSGVSSPANRGEYFNVAVGATDFDDSRSFFSNFGSTLDICAPGQFRSIYTLGRDSSTDINPQFDGTSAAAPHVTGAAALIWYANPDLEPVEVLQILYTSADDVVGAYPEDTKWWDPYHGWGRVNLAKAFGLTEGFSHEWALLFNRGTRPLIIDNIRQDAIPAKTWLSWSPSGSTYTTPINLPLQLGLPNGLDNRYAMRVSVDLDEAPNESERVRIIIDNNDNDFVWADGEFFPKDPLPYGFYVRLIENSVAATSDPAAWTGY